MNAGQLLKVAKDIIVLLEVQGILLPDGSFDQTKLDTIAENVAFAVAVEQVLKKHGLDLPDKVDKIIQLLPLVAALVS